MDAVFNFLQHKPLWERGIFGIMLQFLVVFMALLLFAFFQSKIDRTSNRQLHLSFGIIFLLLILICWIPAFSLGELNPDESQWILEANYLVASPLSWLRDSYPLYFDRILTILPLVPFAMFAGAGLGYEGTRLCTILLWCVFCLLLMSSAARLFNRQTALWCGFSVAVSIALFKSADFVAYNSELPVVLLCMLAFFFYVLCLTGRSAWPHFFLGASLSAIPFAKDQGIIIALCAQTFVLGTILFQGGMRSALQVILGNCATVLLLCSPHIVFWSWEMIARTLMSRMDYSGEPIRQAIFFKTLKIVPALLLSNELKMLCLSGVIVSVPLACLAIRGRILFNRAQVLCMGFAFLVLGAAVFSIVYPTTDFPHYYLFLLFPCSLLLGFAWFFLIGFSNISFTKVAIVFFLLVLFSGSIYQPPAKSGWAPESRNNFVAKKIQEITDPGDRMAVWGWDNFYAVESKLLPGTRFTVPVWLFDTYSQKELWRNFYLEDLRKNKPRIFLTITGPKAFWLSGEQFSLESVPEVADFVFANYDLVYSDLNHRIFLARNASPVQPATAPR